MNNLEDVKNEMGLLYDELKNGKTELKTAAELANIAGKWLKAEQLKFAREMFLAENNLVRPTLLPVRTVRGKADSGSK